MKQIGRGVLTINPESMAHHFSVVLVLACLGVSNVSAGEVDWASMDGTTIKVFYPGVSSFDFLRDGDHGMGATPVKTMKKTCAECHVGRSGEYDIKADEIISGDFAKAKSGKPLEPEPMPGMPGFKDVDLKAAYDAENLYLRFQWEGSGASVTDPSLAQDDRADRLAIQINDNIKSFENFGCFITCHSDQTNMPDNRGDEVKLYAYYAKEGASPKPRDTLDGYLSKGQFMDLWIVSFEGREIRASDQYVLEDRLEDNNDLSVSGGFEQGKYTVVISRKLSSGDPKDITLKDGGAFNVGITVHDNKSTGRHHYVSFPVSIGLSTAADVAAQKL
jgi:hypothetical protein